MDTILLPKVNQRNVPAALAPSCFLSKLNVVKHRLKNTHQYDGRIGAPHYSIGYLVKGQAVFTSDKERFELGSGEIVYVPRCEKYVSHWTGSPEIEYCSIHYLLNPADQVNDCAGTIRRYKLQKICGCDNSINSKFGEIYAAYKEGGNSMLTALSTFYSLYRSIVEMLAYEELPVIKNPVQAAIDYIESHPAEDFYVADLSALCNMSESKFYKVFQHIVGCTPIGYKNRVRINRAIELLAEQDNTVEKISDLLSFSSPAYFRKIFNKITGKNPHEYRYSP